MDNVCHTLVGAAIGEAGLKTRTRFGNPALMIAANLPDLDVLIFVTSTPSVAFRRGWTHGILAQLLLPLLFTGAMLLWDRWRPRRAASDPPARAGALLAISSIGVLSHVLLDYLNNYGVRLLMPFSSQWFYGDTLFIVDVWLWLIFGAGVFFARRHRRVGHARAAVAVATLYMVVMVISAGTARRIVLDAWARERGHHPRAWMVGPRALTPLSKSVIIDAGDHYETGTFSWWGARVRLDPTRLPNRTADPYVLTAQEDPTVRAILRWARFPYYEIAAEASGVTVTLTDLRFGARVGQARVTVPRQAATATDSVREPGGSEFNARRQASVAQQ